jgi:exonuclease SbcC
VNIEKVIIKGFQSHIDSSFQLAPGLTVITGPSDAGKTAIIRALRWLAFNEPQGEGFLHTIRNADGSVKSSADQAEVTVVFDNGVTVTKTRRKGKTTYTHSLYPEPWEKAEVPPEIKETIGLLKQTYGDFETGLNFAFQLDPPFLLSETGSVGAKVLGKLAGTEVVDRAIGATNKQVHNTRTALAFAEKTIGQLDVELLEYLAVDQNFAALLTLEQRFQDAETVFVTQKTLIDLNNGYTAVVERCIATFDILQPLECVPLLQTRADAVGCDYGKLQVLEKESADFWNAVKARQVAGATVRKLEDVGVLSGRLSDLDQLYERLTALTGLQTAYTKTQDAISGYRDTLAVADTALKQSAVLETVEQSDRQLQWFICLHDTHRTATDALNRVRGRLDTFNGLDVLPGKLERVQDVAETLGIYVRLSDRAVHAGNVAIQMHTELRAAEDNEQEAQAALTEAWDAAGGVCPLCEQPLKGGACIC